MQRIRRMLDSRPNVAVDSWCENRREKSLFLFLGGTFSETVKVPLGKLRPDDPFILLRYMYDPDDFEEDLKSEIEGELLRQVPDENFEAILSGTLKSGIKQLLEMAPLYPFDTVDLCGIPDLNEKRSTIRKKLGKFVSSHLGLSCEAGVLTDQVLSELSKNPISLKFLSEYASRVFGSRPICRSVLLGIIPYPFALIPVSCALATIIILLARKYSWRSNELLAGCLAGFVISFILTGCLSWQAVRIRPFTVDNLVNSLIEESNCRKF